MALAAHAAHYAEEHDRYLALGGLPTVLDVERLLRAEHDDALFDVFDEDPREVRDFVVRDLLRAAGERPHPVWTLLLAIAFEDELLGGYAEALAFEDEPQEGKVVEAFEACLEALDPMDPIETWIDGVRDRLATSLSPGGTGRRRRVFRTAPPVTARSREHIDRRSLEGMGFVRRPPRCWTPFDAERDARKRDRARRVRDGRERTRRADRRRL